MSHFNARICMLVSLGASILCTIGIALVFRTHFATSELNDWPIYRAVLLSILTPLLSFYSLYFFPTSRVSVRIALIVPWLVLFALFFFPAALSDWLGLETRSLAWGLFVFSGPVLVLLLNTHALLLQRFYERGKGPLLMLLIFFVPVGLAIREWKVAGRRYLSFLSMAEPWTPKQDRETTRSAPQMPPPENCWRLNYIENVPAWLEKKCRNPEAFIHEQREAALARQPKSIPRPPERTKAAPIKKWRPPAKRKNSSRH